MSVAVILGDRCGGVNFGGNVLISVLLVPEFRKVEIGVRLYKTALKELYRPLIREGVTQIYVTKKNRAKRQVPVSDPRTP